MTQFSVFSQKKIKENQKEATSTCLAWVKTFVFAPKFTIKRRSFVQWSPGILMLLLQQKAFWNTGIFVPLMEEEAACNVKTAVDLEPWDLGLRPDRIMY